MPGSIFRFGVEPEGREAFIRAVVEHGRAAVPVERSRDGTGDRAPAERLAPLPT
jgi:hypothetical protein